MIDISIEELVAVSDIPKLLPKRSGKRIHRSSVYRWILRGIGGCKLEAVRVGRQMFTSKEALQRFVDRKAIDGCAGKSSASSLSRTKQIEISANQVERFLRKDGTNPTGSVQRDE